MEVRDALKIVKRAVDEEIPHLKSLSRKNSELPLWFDKMKDTLEAAFGKDSEQYNRFVYAVHTVRYAGTEEEFQESYVRRLMQYEVALKSILQRQEILPVPASRRGPATSTPPQVFIAHGGDCPASEKVCQFITALGAKPVMVEREPSQDRSVDDNVNWYLSQADCALILATTGDIDGKTGDFIPRGNVLIEVGRCQERLPGKVIYLLEEKARFPSNISEKVWEHFTQDNMEQAFIKIARELAAFGLIKAVKGT